jgi:hypothetical protein
MGVAAQREGRVINASRAALPRFDHYRSVLTLPGPPCLISRLISRRLLLLLNLPKELAKVQNLGPSRRGTLPSVVFFNFK